MRLGIDAGTYSIKIVLMDQDEIVKKIEQPHHNRVKEVTCQMLESLSLPGEVEVLTSGAMSHLLGLPKEAILPEKKAMTIGLSAMDCDFSSAIFLGAAGTYYVEKTTANHMDIRKNSNCSAGTGAFFEEQVTRLGMPLEQISSVVKEATSIPQMAGRCSVFSKTDMIHKMQEGVSTPDILLGLCYALVRNYKSTILHNQPPKKPVYLAGGVMKNAGVLSALKELLSLEDGDFILDENADYILASGLAKCASSAMPTTSLLENIKKDSIVIDENFLPPLMDFIREDDKPEFSTVELNPDEDHYLGIDIGSTSINLVLINEKKEVVYYSYVKTLGRPLDIVETEIEKMKKQLGSDFSYKIAVTGSGREYVGKSIGADLIINEISAQCAGATLHHPNTDTIFEIGGQDSKYMKLASGKMTSFEMNKVCAAGTGAFLEEEIKKLDLSMEDFINLALSAKHPCSLGNRCTVFIESSVQKALSQGYELADVCAGLVYAIVSNYLFRVVNNRAIGENIAIQGGIAYNQAVVCAFRSITKKSIHVTSYFAVTGALGAASLLLGRQALVFNKEKNQELNRQLLERSESSYLKDYKPPVAGSTKKRIGVPRVIFLHKMFPLFATMFDALGFDVVLSPLSDREIVTKAQNYATAEVCYPIKLIYGHIAWLLEQNVDYIILPRLYTIKHEGSVARKDYACMYMQTSPLLMEEAFGLKERGVTLLMPELSLQFGKKFMVQSLLSMSDALGVAKPRMLPAAVKGFAHLVAHSERLEAIGKENLDTDEPIFVLVSRVYNIADPILNMGIEKHLNELGCRVIHLEHLEASYMNVEHDYKDMYWPFGQHILTGLKLIKNNKNLYPIYITNHGCGPDTAIQHFFDHEMEGREYLQLEVDEHSSAVGVITRIEAFLYSLQPQEKCKLSTCPDTSKNFSDTALLPDLGIYTDILKKHLPKDYENILVAKPLMSHKTINYAMNKEYFSLLVFLEELINVMDFEKTYDFYCPIDEGSEVFGQYALLAFQEFSRLGYHVNLHTFFMEDLIKRDDIEEIFTEMIDAETSSWEKSCNNKAESANYILGEPLAVIKEAVGDKSMLGMSRRMPLSEAWLFHMKMVDRKKIYKKEIEKLTAIHRAVLSEKETSGLYSDLDKIEDACRGRLDFCIGNFAKYRFGKLLCLDPSLAEKVYIIQSAEENAAIILKQLYATYREKIAVDFSSIDLDFEHKITEADL